MSGESNGKDDTGDAWFRWLLKRRDGGDKEYQRLVQEEVERIADRVLDAAQLQPDFTLADVGAGEGLIAFRAISRIGPSLRVIFTDISPALLKHAKQLAVERGVGTQCSFIEGTAEKIVGVVDASVDAVTTRAALTYVADKPATLREFHRVLKPGGRISLGEPIRQDDAFETVALGKFIEAQPAHVGTDFLRLLYRWKAAQFPATEAEIRRNLMVNYSERDLFRLAREAGFSNIHLELHINVRPTLVTNWQTFLDTSTHPLALTGGEILEQQFSQAERQLFEQVMRPTIESGQSMATDIMAYLTATKS